MSLKCWDAERTICVLLSLTRKAFELYRVDHPGQIGFDIAAMHAILKKWAWSSLRISIYKYREAPGKIFLQGSLLKTIKVTTEEEDVPEIGEFNFSVRVKMRSAVFRSIVTLTTGYGDRLSITVGPDDITIESAEKGNRGKMVVLATDETVLDVDGPCKATFGCGVLEPMMHASKVSEYTELNFGVACPVRFKFAIPVDEGWAMYYIGNAEIMDLQEARTGDGNEQSE